MPDALDNAALAERLEAFAGLLDLAEASPYTARAYRRASETIRETPAPVAELVRSGRVEELRGIGPGIAARLRELVDTGRIAELDELEQEVRPELVARLDADRTRPARGLRLDRARRLVEDVAGALHGEPAGDARRWAELSFDLSVVVPTDEPEDVIAAFERLPQIVTLVDRGDRYALGVTVEGLPIALHLPERHRFGTELVRRTGAQVYVDALADLPDAHDEVGVYTALGVPWCPPELREAPFHGDPPALVELADIRGDLHCHTTWSDGRASVLEMATAARDLGYAYVAICDHTPNVRVVPGLDADALRRQADDIAAVNEQLAPFHVLRGVEVDILRDGGLDLPDDVLAELDWVQLSLHAGQREQRDTLTAKVTDAMQHPAVRCLSHPTGRILDHRPPSALDLEAVFAVAHEHGVALEVNGLPARLDLSGPNVKLAIEAGVAVVASTDAHSVLGLGNMSLAVATARRGWATAADVLNTRPLEAVLSHRRR